MFFVIVDRCSQQQWWIPIVDGWWFSVGWSWIVFTPVDCGNLIAPAIIHNDDTGQQLVDGGMLSHSGGVTEVETPMEF